jgi:hypothetical protein
MNVFIATYLVEIGVPFAFFPFPTIIFFAECVVLSTFYGYYQFWNGGPGVA